MPTLTIHHRTSYRYREPVTLGPHRLMLRPRETRDLRLISVELKIEPEANVVWSGDVFGNAVATATFPAPTDTLTIDSFVKLRLEAEPWPVFPVAASAISYPFLYSDDDWADLGSLTVRQYPDPDRRLETWARSFVRSNPTDTLSLLKDLSAGVLLFVQYEVRDDEGTQSPVGTLERGYGSCRDFAVLLAEAARLLGFGARVVSGYLYDPAQNMTGSAGEGSTHAWTEIYVPGAGWITFDPTNRIVGGKNLIPVAVARNIEQIMPVSGNFTGRPEAFEEMSVAVHVT